MRAERTILLRATRSLLSSNGTRYSSRRVQCRRFASVAQDDSKLPLKGYKVLDMTRVLAGVSDVVHRLSLRLIDFAAILYTNFGRPWVSDNVMGSSYKGLTSLEQKSSRSSILREEMIHEHGDRHTRSTRKGQERRDLVKVLTTYLYLSVDSLTVFPGLTTTGKSEQEVASSFLPTSPWYRDPPKTRLRKRHPRRELPPRHTQEIPNGLPITFQNQSTIDLCLYHRLRSNRAIFQSCRLRCHG